MLSQPSRTNQRARQCLGTKFGSPADANVKELKKKKANMTAMERRMHHQRLRYIVALVVCLRSLRSFIVAFNELRVQT